MYEELYDFFKLDELRENHRHLYHQIREYLYTLNSDDHWVFEYGTFLKPDALSVYLEFRSMRKTTLRLFVQAERSGSDYSFVSRQVDEAN